TTHTATSGSSPHHPDDPQIRRYCASFSYSCKVFERKGSYVGGHVRFGTLRLYLADRTSKRRFGNLHRVARADNFRPLCNDHGHTPSEYTSLQSPKPHCPRHDSLRDATVTNSGRT